MTQLEFYKSYQFVAELIIAELLFCFKLERRSYFYLRLPAALAVVVVLSRFFPVPPTLAENALYISFMFFCIFMYTVLASKFLFKEDWLKIILCMLAGYTVQHIAYELYNLLLTVMGINADSPMGSYGNGEATFFENPFAAAMYITVYVIVYFICAILFGRKIEGREKLKISNTFVFVFAALLFVIDIIINAFIIYYIAPGGNRLYLSITGLYNILCCIVVLFLMFEVAARKKLSDTLHSVNLLRQREKERYEISKENIELINMKCHDLKHLIRNIGANSALSEESIAEIENSIQIYDSALHTGNDALDVILMEKLLKCNKNGIKLSCITDGERLGFMREDDIYSLFGNLIDNAIEAVLPLDSGKRVISLSIRAVKNLLSVNLHNFYEKELKFENGLPVTTKSDKNYHGYGMKSVEYICSRYGGDLSISTENNVFNINILFPIK